MKSTLIVSLMLLAALIPVASVQAEKQEGVMQKTPAASLDVAVPENATRAFDPVYAPYAGYGSVTVLNDGVILVRIDGDPPASDGAQGREPLESYALAMGTEGLSLVNAGSFWFLDHKGDALTQRGLSTAEVSQIPLGGKSEAEPDGCQRQAVLTIKGDLLFDWVPETSSGYIHVATEDGSREFEAEFAAHDQSGTLSIGGIFRSRGWCEVDCPQGHCEIWCSFFGIIRQARCYCDGLGQPVCECLGLSGDFQIVVRQLLKRSWTPRRQTTLSKLSDVHRHAMIPRIT